MVKKNRNWKNSLPEEERDAGLSCRVPEALRIRARTFGVAQGTTLQEVVIAALDEYLRKRGA